MAATSFKEEYCIITISRNVMNPDTINSVIVTIRRISLTVSPGLPTLSIRIRYIVTFIIARYKNTPK
ncbi:MAG: hypothetical protein J6U00_01280, partial [Ruminococcus sp.]|uniref:hypothetical protein n=1 Tax=Ruminococcus sp. TaxID=41978 RepID=UPI001B2B6F0F